jgi:hypothetical protein
MLERYSHIRMNAKRLAMECMTLKPKANVRPDSQAAHKPGNPERLNRTNDGKCENSVPNKIAAADLSTEWHKAKPA